MIAEFLIVASNRSPSFAALKDIGGAIALDIGLD